jgi:hypothetical protein
VYASYCVWGFPLLVLSDTKRAPAFIFTGLKPKGLAKRENWLWSNSFYVGLIWSILIWPFFARSFSLTFAFFFASYH